MTWTIDQFTQPIPIDFAKRLFDNYVIASSLIFMMVLCISYNLIHRILTKNFASYNQLNQATQLVVTQHTIEAIMLSLCILPHTWLMLSANFEQQDTALIKLKLQLIITICACIMVMYLIELATRYRHLRPLVVAHHLLASTNILLGGLFPQTAFLKGGSILALFITYECVTFVGLVMYRLYPEKQITPRIITAGMYLMAFSRPVQLVWIVASLVVAWEHLVMWQAVVQIIFAFVFTIVQLYSLKIHSNIRKRCIEKQENEVRDVPKEEIGFPDLTTVSVEIDSEEPSSEENA